MCPAGFAERLERSTDDTASPRSEQTPASTMVVGAADDYAEREADRVAGEVIARLHGGAADTHTHSAHCGHGDVRRSAAPAGGAEVGVEGGAISEGLSSRIESRRGGGTALPTAVRRRLESGFGGSLADVRIHTDGEAARLSRAVSARAFTTGKDIFFGAGEFRPDTPEGEHVLAHEVAHTRQPAGATRRYVDGPVIRRAPRSIQKGTLPITKIQQDRTAGRTDVDHDHDLLYGMSAPRGQDKGAVTGDDTTQGADKRFRTIDEYNRALNINKWISFNGAAIGLMHVRDQLRSTSDWAPLVGGQDVLDANEDALDAWVILLRQRRDHIGLYDLADKKKIKARGRFTKNRIADSKRDEKARSRKDRMTEEDVAAYLAYDDVNAAQAYLDNLDPKDKTFLDRWITMAFFRRTSKLGQDFVIQRGGMVHFNTAADLDYDADAARAGTYTSKKYTKGGVGKVAGKKPKDNRAITVSEHRHMKKLIKADKSKAKNFNVYDHMKWDDGK